MGLNVSTHMAFENRNLMRNTAKEILVNSGATHEKAAEIADQAIFENSQLYSNSQLAVLKASTQISLNNTLKETLNYLKNHADKKVKRVAILGELWNSLSEANEVLETGELFDFKVDLNAKNIFAA